MTSVLRGIHDARMNLPPGAVFTGDPSHCPTSPNFPLPQEAPRYRRSASFHDFVNKLLVVKSASSKAGTQFHKNIADQDSLSSYGPIISANRQVQTRSRVVWGGAVRCRPLPDWTGSFYSDHRYEAPMSKASSGVPNQSPERKTVGS
jgi:hypothetical protein